MAVGVGVGVVGWGVGRVAVGMGVGVGVVLRVAVQEYLASQHLSSLLSNTTPHLLHARFFRILPVDEERPPHPQSSF